MSERLPAKASLNRWQGQYAALEIVDLSGHVRAIRDTADHHGNTLFDTTSEPSRYNLPEPLTSMLIEYSKLNTSDNQDALRLRTKISFSPQAFKSIPEAAFWQSDIVSELCQEMSALGFDCHFTFHDPSSLTIHSHDGPATRVKAYVDDHTGNCVLRAEITDTTLPQHPEELFSTIRYDLYGVLTISNAMINLLAEKYHKAPLEQPVTIPASYYQPKSILPTHDEIDPASTSFDQIGGCHQAISRLKSLALASQHSEAALKYGIPLTGSFLLHGPAGTGKTTLVQAFAKSADAELMTISSSDIVSKWVGKSAKNLEEIFDQASSQDHRVVLFFDEFDSLAPRGDRISNERIDVKNILKQRLTSLPQHVIVAAATNLDPHNFDEAIVRSGRFEPIYVAKPNENERCEIWSAVIVNSMAEIASSQDADLCDDEKVFMPYSPDIDPLALAKASNDMVGADFVEILRRARTKKFLAHVANGSLDYPQVTQTDLMHEIISFYSR